MFDWRWSSAAFACLPVLQTIRHAGRAPRQLPWPRSVGAITLRERRRWTRDVGSKQARALLRRLPKRSGVRSIRLSFLETPRELARIDETPKKFKSPFHQLVKRLRKIGELGTFGNNQYPMFGVFVSGFPTRSAKRHQKRWRRVRSRPCSCSCFFLSNCEQTIPCMLASRVSVPMTIDDRNDDQRIDRKGLS